MLKINAKCLALLSTHTYTYTYVCVCVCMCVSLSSLGLFISRTVFCFRCFKWTLLRDAYLWVIYSLKRHLLVRNKPLPMTLCLCVCVCVRACVCVCVRDSHTHLHIRTHWHLLMPRHTHIRFWPLRLVYSTASSGHVAWSPHLRGIKMQKRVYSWKSGRYTYTTFSPLFSTIACAGVCVWGCQLWVACLLFFIDLHISTIWCLCAFLIT